MAELKTKPTAQNVADYLNTIEPEEKRRDSFEILSMMEKITGEQAVMWGTSIVGFGKYHYKSERSSQEGDWPLIGFSPRKQNITFYIMSGFKDNQDVVKKLGPCKTSVGCLYIKRLSDVDTSVLKILIEDAYLAMKKMYADNIPQLA